MFTGIIQRTGTVMALEGHAAKRLTVRTELAGKLGIGDSIAVNGTCLTAIELTRDSFTADLLEETLRRTTLGSFSTGRVVNLELPVSAGYPLGGHIVQGHVDGVGFILKVARETDASETWRVSVQLPIGLRRYTAEKGSIAIEGISLTVAMLTEDGVEVAIIPHTYSTTNMHTLKIGDEVNIETDPLARYAEQMLKARRSMVTIDRLIENGY